MAKQYRVAVTEFLRKVVTVEAESEKEAHKRAADAWYNGEYLLDSRNFNGAEFYVLGEGDEDGSDKLEHVDGKDAGMPDD
ncbi:MAG: DpnD/PcfM family protein [Oscillospiraceae bacterium]|nr:DpnD/PcfM family protein [Oscillospiraceae bacterium]